MFLWWPSTKINQAMLICQIKKKKKKKKQQPKKKKKKKKKEQRNKTWPPVGRAYVFLYIHIGNFFLSETAGPISI